MAVSGFAIPLHEHSFGIMDDGGLSRCPERFTSRAVSNNVPYLGQPMLQVALCSPDAPQIPP